MNKFIILALVFMMGCSSNRVQLLPRTINDQTVSYVRGSSKLNSQSLLKPELTVLEYSSNTMVIDLQVTNETDSPLLLSKSNLTVDLLTSDEIQAGTVYSFEQVVEQAADEGYDTATQVGSTAASIGSSFIPFGGIMYSVGSLFYSIGGQGTESYQERVDKRLFHN